MRADYKSKKEEIFPKFKFPDDIEIDESAEERAENTTVMLERMTSIGYKHKLELGLIQSKEFGFIGAQEEKAQGNDERRTSYAIQSTQEEAE